MLPPPNIPALHHSSRPNPRSAFAAFGLGIGTKHGQPDFEPLAGLDQYLHSCETKDGWFEFLGPVVRMSRTPPLKGPLTDTIVSPNWASAHEEANAAEIQPT